MFTKNLLVSAAAAAAIAASTAVFAAQAAPNAAAPAAQMPQSTAKIALNDAVQAAQKEVGGSAQGAHLMPTPNNGLVWSVNVQKSDGSASNVLVDAQTGKIVAADAAGMSMNHGMAGSGCPMMSMSHGAAGNGCPMMGQHGQMSGAAAHHDAGRHE